MEEAQNEMNNIGSKLNDLEIFQKSHIVVSLNLFKRDASGNVATS